MAAAVFPNRGPITVSIMLAAMMNTVDSTIVNVSLPHMQGALSATPDQVTWVLTSYIVATAVGTPLSGWLAGRFGLRATIVATITGFTLASMACGVATTLPQIVLFRVLQGLFGAATMPLSQTVLFNINPVERHARAMSIWSTGSVLGPIAGPILGGWLTETLSWRWCFLINLPLGVLAIAGVLIFMPKEDDARRRPFDFLGYTALAIMVGTIQLMLDRGPGEDWFQSAEIWTYALVAMSCLWVFVFHTATASNPFLDPALLRDRNLVTAAIFAFFAGILMFSAFAILPIMTQTLLGNPPMTAGFLNMPRAIGMGIAVTIAGRLADLFDQRAILLTALMVGAYGLWLMSGFDLTMDSHMILFTGLIQGFSTGLFFVPMTTLAFATVSTDLRAEASSVFNLMRNMGASVGISAMQAMALINSGAAHEALAGRVSPEDQTLRAALSAGFDPATLEGAARLNGEITRQAMMIGYLDDFRLLIVMCFVSAPLLLLMRPPKRATA